MPRLPRARKVPIRYAAVGTHHPNICSRRTRGDNEVRGTTTPDAGVAERIDGCRVHQRGIGRCGVAEDRTPGVLEKIGDFVKPASAGDEPHFFDSEITHAVFHPLGLR